MDGRIEYVVLNETQNKYQDKTLFLGPKAKPSKNELPEAKPKPKAKPVGFLAGPKLPPRNDGGSGGTGRINVLDDKKKLNIMDNISKYMNKTGQIPYQ